MTLDKIEERLATATERPRTLLLERIGGTCARPEIIAQAGGEPCPSLADAPDVLLLVLPETSLDDAEEEVLALAETPGWFELPCVRGGECYLIDAARLAESEPQALWILATVLHPDRFTEMLPPYSVRMFPKELYEVPNDTAR